VESNHGRGITRRELWQAGITAAAVGAIGCKRQGAPRGVRGKAPVAILRAATYQEDLLDRLWRGAEACGLEARGKRVLLKPNLVECERGGVIHTQAEVLEAPAALFEKLGAAEVRIGEGPGHRRDAMFLAEEAGFGRQPKETA